MDFKENTYGGIARRCLEDMEFLKDNRLHLAVFSAQQAVEKILKQYLDSYYIGIDKADVLGEHDFIVLAQKSCIPGLQEYETVMRSVSDFYSKGRYPGIDYETPSREDVEEIVPQVREIFAIVEQAIEKAERDKQYIVFKRSDLFDS